MLFTCCGCDAVQFTANALDDSLYLNDIGNSGFETCDQMGIFAVENTDLLDGSLIPIRIVGEQVVLGFLYVFPLHQQGHISHPDHMQVFWTQYCKDTQFFMLKMYYY